MPLPAAIDEGQQGQEGHGGTLHRQTDQFIREDLQGLVVGQEIPLRLDVGRRHQGIGREKGVLGEKQVGVEKDHRQEEGQVDEDRAQVLQGIVGEERDSAGMLLIAVAVAGPLVGGVALTEGGRRDAGALQEEQVGSDQGGDPGRDDRHVQGKEAP